MEVTAVGAVHYIVGYLTGWNTRNERTTKGGEVPQAGEQESVMESGGAGVPVLFQQQTAARRKCCRNFNIGILQQKSWHLEQR